MRPATPHRCCMSMNLAQHGVARARQCPLPRRNPKVKVQSKAIIPAWRKARPHQRNFACTAWIEPEARVPLDACADTGRLRLAQLRPTGTIPYLLAREMPCQNVPKESKHPQRSGRIPPLHLQNGSRCLYVNFASLRHPAAPGSRPH